MSRERQHTPSLRKWRYSPAAIVNGSLTGIMSPQEEDEDGNDETEDEHAAKVQKNLIVSSAVSPLFL